MVNASCNAQTFRVLFDTGASQNIISAHTVDTLGLSASVQQAPTSLRFVGAFTGTTNNVLPTCHLKVLQITDPHARPNALDIPPAHNIWVAPGHLPGGVDMILGDPYLAATKASFAYADSALVLTCPVSAAQVTIDVRQTGHPLLDVTTRKRFNGFLRTHVAPQPAEWFVGAAFVMANTSEEPDLSPNVSIMALSAADVIHPATKSLAACLPEGGDAAARAAAEEVLQEFGDIFLGKDDLIPTRDADRPWPAENHARVETAPGAPPPSVPLRRMSPNKLEWLSEDIAKLIDNGFIQPSASPYGAAVLYAIHPDTGKRRLCFDYRQLNDITVKDKTPLPTISDLMAIVGSKRPKYFTVLDLKEGYHQIPMAADSVHKTAFRCRYGLYEWLVMPFGLTNAPAIFSRIITQLLRPFLDKFCVAYLDDILIYSATLEEHQQHVRTVLGVLLNNQMSLNRDKCRLFVTEVTFLNYRLHAGTVSVVPRYVDALRTFIATPPTDKTQVRRFLGAANFYRTFIEGFSRVAEPLLDLTRDRVPFHWTPACQAALERLIGELSKGPILRLPEDKPFLLFTDASNVAIGACLMQMDAGTKRPHPIAYFSRTLQGSERRYAAFCRELLAIVVAVEYFRPYLESRDDTLIFTDHKPIIDAVRSKDLTTNDKHARWITRILSFKATVCYIPGGLNNIADLLSRPFGDDSVKRASATNATNAASANDDDAQTNPYLGVIFQVSHAHPDRPRTIGVSEPTETDLLIEFKAAAERCKLYRAAFDARSREHPNASDLNKQFLGVPFRDLCVCDTSGLLFRVKTTIGGQQHRQYLVPDDKDLRYRLLAEHHASAFSGGHLGRDKLLKRLEHTFWWPGMTTDVADFVKNCPVCQAIKPTTQAKPGLLRPLPIPDRPMASLTMDFVGPLPRTARGHQYVLTVVDRMSKFMLLLPMRSLTVEATVDALQRHFVSIWGIPANIVTDRGPQFVADLWKQLWTAVGTTLSLTAPYHPETDGQSERMNRTWKDMLRSFIDRNAKGTWDQLLPSIQHAFNTSAHAATKLSPFEVVFGYKARIPATVGFPQPADTAYLQAMQAYRQQAIDFAKSYQDRMRATADRHRRDVRYKLGDRVLVDASKQRLSDDQSKQRSSLDPKWWGPYTITEVWDNNPNVVRIDFDPTSAKAKHNVINVSHVRPAPGAPSPGIDDEFIRIFEHNLATGPRGTQGPAGGPHPADATPVALQPTLRSRPPHDPTVSGPLALPSDVSRSPSLASNPLRLSPTPALPPSGSVPSSPSESLVIELSESDDASISALFATATHQAGTACIWRGGEMLQEDYHTGQGPP